MTTKSNASLADQCTMDFLSDWRHHLQLELLAQGFDSIGPENAHSLFEKLMNLERRQVSAVPRKIAISKEFTCPKEVEPGWEETKRKILAGESLRPHLSTKLLQADYQDPLLNDWGILHFHLDASPDPNRPDFNTRTGRLLFARVTPDVFYAIDVKDHTAWTDLDLLEIVHAN